MGTQLLENCEVGQKGFLKRPNGEFDNGDEILMIGKECEIEATILQLTREQMYIQIIAKRKKLDEKKA